MKTTKKSHVNFAEHAYALISAAIASIEPEIAGDIYALSFFIEDDDDDPRRPTLTLGYNTNRHWKESIKRASGPAEAKWNYAFWLQNDPCVIGEAGSESASLRDEWFKSLNLGFTDKEWDEDMDHCCEIGEKMTAKFVGLAVLIAQRLHRDGAIRRRWPNAIPILVHELEYYDQITEQCREANPPGVAAEFETWMASMG